MLPPTLLYYVLLHLGYVGLAYSTSTRKSTSWCHVHIDYTESAAAKKSADAATDLAVRAQRQVLEELVNLTAPTPEHQEYERKMMQVLNQELEIQNRDPNYQKSPKYLALQAQERDISHSLALIIKAEQFKQRPNRNRINRLADDLDKKTQMQQAAKTKSDAAAAKSSAALDALVDARAKRSAKLEEIEKAYEKLNVTEHERFIDAVKIERSGTTLVSAHFTEPEDTQLNELRQEIEAAKLAMLSNKDAKDAALAEFKKEEQVAMRDLDQLSGWFGTIMVNQYIKSGMKLGNIARKTVKGALEGGPMGAIIEGMEQAAELGIENYMDRNKPGGPDPAEIEKEVKEGMHKALHRKKDSDELKDTILEETGKHVVGKIVAPGASAGLWIQIEWLKTQKEKGEFLKKLISQYEHVQNERVDNFLKDQAKDFINLCLRAPRTTKSRRFRHVLRSAQSLISW